MIRRAGPGGGVAGGGGFDPLRKATLLVLTVAPMGCSFDTRPVSPPLSLTVTAPISIPAGTAHATFQDGRLAGGSNKLNPYCELEVRTVSGGEPQWITHGDFQVSRIAGQLLQDPTTRVPALFGVISCSDPVFQESVWRLTSSAPSDVMFLRCIAPYYHCAFGPPLSPEQVQQQVGRYLAVRVGQPAAVDAR